MQIKHGKVQQVGAKKVTREPAPSASFLNDREPERQHRFDTATAPVNALSETNHSFREERSISVYLKQRHLTQRSG
jgi:hypothetical protein